MTTLEFFFDIGSPYSYLAAGQVEAVAADCGAALRWRPFLLGGVFKLTGNQPPALLPERGRYMLADLQRWAAFYGVPFHFPDTFPANTLRTMRALTALRPDALPAGAHALFHAYWVDGRDPGDPEVLADVLGLEAAARADDPAVKQALIDTTEEAVRRGAFGAPSFFVGDQLFFGNDRLPFVEQALRRAGRD